MSKVLIISLLIRSVFLIEFSSLENNELVEVFSENLYNRGTQLQRIRNVPTNNSSSKKMEIAKRFLGHYNSLKPVAVLVDDIEQAYEDVNIFFKNVFDATPNAKYINFTFFKFNSTGISPILYTNNGSNWKKIDYKFKRESSFLGPLQTNGTAAFFAILNTATNLPRNGAILMFLDRKVVDEDLASHAGLLRKNNNRVYVIWGGSYPSKSSEEHLLREVCEYTGGLFLPNTEKKLSGYNYRLFLENAGNFNVSTILSRSNVVGLSEFTFPIDSKVTDIHIKISPSTDSGSLSSPEGYIIDILENDDIADYSTGSFGVTERGLREVHLNVATAQTHGVGFWRLKLNNTRKPYNVTVFAFAKLTVSAYIVQKNSSSENVGYPKKILKLGISDDVTLISNVSLVDHNGHATSDKAEYTLVKDWLIEKNDNVSYDNREIDIEVNNVSKQSVYALVQGKDSEGNEFMRLTYLNPYNLNNIFPQQTLTIDVGVGSQLITTGGSFPVILFEVTNHKATAVDVRFYCRDSKSILRSMEPYRKIISPEETVVVRVILTTKYGSYQDEMDFTASLGSETFTKKVLVDVGTQTGYDSVEPELDYTFSSDCAKVIFSQCNQGTWTVKITARDTGSGLLQVTTVPKGIYFPNGFTTGTKEQVEGYYSGSCCSPDLQIISIDRMNNRVIRNVNAYLAFWGPAQIAALVLGLLLLIFLVALIIYLIVKCVKKRENYDLPTYRGGRI